MEQQHKKLLTLLIEFKNICEKAEIWYSLGYGTALGAVRHQGFIPWDSDVDVLIMLPDKDKFREAFLKYKPKNIIIKMYDKEKKNLQSHDVLYLKNDPEISLDICPLVGAPSDYKTQKKITKKYSYQDKIIRSKYVSLKKAKKRNKLLLIGAKILCFFIPDRLLKKNIYKRENKFNFYESNYLMTLSGYPRPGECIPKKVFDDRIIVLFEGIEFKIPRLYEEYLIGIYGKDYMVPKKY